jgi:hypothetical protein
MNYKFYKASKKDIPLIWVLIQDAIALRKKDGSNQWQDGYPNEEVIKNDIKNGIGHVLLDGSKIIGYVAILYNDEPAYKEIKGAWLTNDEFMVLHRIAISKNYLGTGMAQKIMEQFKIKHQEALQHISTFKDKKFVKNYCPELTWTPENFLILTTKVMGEEEVKRYSTTAVVSEEKSNSEPEAVTAYFRKLEEYFILSYTEGGIAQEIFAAFEKQSKLKRGKDGIPYPITKSYFNSHSSIIKWGKNNRLDLNFFSEKI